MGREQGAPLGAAVGEGLRADLLTAWGNRALLRLMVRRELEARFAGTALGVFWLYAQPILTLAVYYLVFDIVLKARLGLDGHGQALGAYLIAGMVPWMAFSEGLSRSMISLTEAGGLLQKNALPLALFPLKSCLATTVLYLPLLLAVAVIYALTAGVTAAWVLLPALIVLLFVLLWLLGYLVAVMTAAMRDVGQVVGFGLSLGIFLSPVLFPMASFPAALHFLLWLNPMTPLVLGFQAILLHGAFPDIMTWGGTAFWLVVAAWALDRVIRRGREHLVDWL